MLGMSGLRPCTQTHLKISFMPYSPVWWACDKYRRYWLICHCAGWDNTPLTCSIQTALQRGSDRVGWEDTFIEAGISGASAKTCVQTFSSKKITRDSLHKLDHAKLKELGIKSMGDMFTILKLTKEPLASHPKPPSVKLPNSSWRWFHNSSKSSE